MNNQSHHILLKGILHVILALIAGFVVSGFDNGGPDIEKHCFKNIEPLIKSTLVGKICLKE